MNWLNIHTDILRSSEFLGAEPLERATWLALLGWCATQENGGVIGGAKAWNDRRWQQTCGVTKAEAETASDLYYFEGDSLVVNFYPVEKQAEVVAKREAGKRGGRPRKPLQTGGEKPDGSDQLNLEDQLSKSEAETERKRREEKERKEKEKKLKEEAETVYQAYPRKIEKQPALKAIIKALKTTPLTQILDHLKLYSESVKDKDKQFLPYPATYFNKCRHLEPVEIITTPSLFTKPKTLAEKRGYGS